MVLTIITCPRVGASYVEATLNWVDEQSKDIDIKRYIICDSEPVFRDKWATEQIKKQWTPHSLPANKWAGWHALKIAADLKEDLIFLEDDISPKGPDALQSIIKSEVGEGIDWVSFYHPVRNPGKYPAVSFTYCQALKIPLKTVNKLIKLPNIVTGDWEGTRGFDEALAALGRGMTFEQKSAIINHIGDISVANPRL
ncbi:MAG TPA: hypothetical protein VHD33_00010 [Legionellaceae bacterium]|nr:hypothetical protein [Legionellaceae bacterium]